MKKLILILLVFSFSGQELIAQLGSAGSGKIYRNTGGADRGSTSGVFGTQGDWSTDLVISEKTPATAANDYVGPTHNGMGATGWGSFVAGAYNRASGAGAVAIGFHNVAGPTGSDISSIPPSTTNLGGQFAVGYGTQATGHATFSAGQGTTASGNYSTALGYGSTASSTISTAMGLSTTASGYASTSMGQGTTASGNYSTAMGLSSTASGHYSMAAVRNTTASDYASVVIGQYNSSGSSVTNSASSFSTSNTAFVIGNGTASNAKSDAFKVMFNGDATVSNDLTVSGDITISSDARLKSNIVSLGATLSKLLLIDGKSYIMNKSGKEKIGVLAQDIQKVFPELVSEDDNEMLSVNYQGLVPVLINALKEQQVEIEKLKEQEKRIIKLEELISQLK